MGLLSPKRSSPSKIYIVYVQLSICNETVFNGYLFNWFRQVSIQIRVMFLGGCFCQIYLDCDHLKGKWSAVDGA